MRVLLYKGKKQDKLSPRILGGVALILVYP